VIETDRTWEYAEPHERSFMPHTLLEGNKGYWLVDGRVIPRRRNVGVDTSVAAQEMADLQGRLRHMDELGIDVQVLYPTLFLLPLTRRPEVESALCRSYNRWMADIWAHAKERLRWAVVLPLMGLDTALDELRFGREHGACAVFWRGIEGDRVITDPYFYPIYQEASDLNLPICVHAADGNFIHHDFFIDDPVHKFKFPVMGAFQAVVFNDLATRFPRLRFGFIEAGAQWVPWALYHLSRRFAIGQREMSEDVLGQHRLYVACETGEDLAYLVSRAGEDHLVIGTDYGHADTSAEITALRKLREQDIVSPATVDKILGANPQALYGLPPS
jgi:predicted TIM-barrel fold metal-dependent hydrolase